MLAFRAQCEGLSMSAMAARLITTDWANVHGHLGPEAMRRMYAEIQEPPKRRIKTAGGRWRKVAA